MVGSPSVPGAITVYELTGGEIVPITIGQSSVQTTTGTIGALGATITLTAGTNLAAGTAVSVNSAGHAVQTWGPAPNVNGLVKLGEAGISSVNSCVLMLTSTVGIAFLGFSSGALPFTVNLSTGAITLGVLNTDAKLSSVTWSGFAPSGILAGAPTATRLSGTTFAIAYQPEAGGLWTAFGSISGSGAGLAITINAPAEFDTNNFYTNGWAWVTALTATSYVISYGNSAGSNSLNIVGVSVSGTTPSPGTPVNIDPGTGGNITALFLTTTTFLVIWENTSTSFIEAQVGALSGNSITMQGSPAVSAFSIANNGAPGFSALVLSATQVAISAALDTLGPPAYNGGIICLISISGASVSFGATTPAPAAAVMAALDTTHLIVAGGIGVPNTIGSIDNVNVRTFIAPQVYTLTGGAFVPAGASQASQYSALGGVVTQSSSLYIASLSDGLYTWPLVEGDNNGNMSPPFQHYGLLGYWIYPLDSTHVLATLMDTLDNLYARVINTPAFTNAPPIGCVASAVTSGNPATITLSGPCSGFSGLTPGAGYYANGDGTLTTANTGHPMGVAAKSSQLIVSLK